ncbi:MAG: hypothetical protein WC563_15785 [Brevundimonas sp.]
MAANSLVHAAPGWAQGEKLTPTQITAVGEQAAQSVNRNSTVSGTRYFQIKPISQYDNATELYNHNHPDNKIILKNVGPGGGAPILHIPLDGLLHKQTLTAAALRLKPAAGHGAAPLVIGTLPTFKVRRADVLGAIVDIGTATYVWVDVATYEAGFYLSALAMTEVVDLAQYTYHLAYTSEWGANSVTGLMLACMAVTMTIDHAYGGTDLSMWV